MSINDEITAVLTDAGLAQNEERDGGQSGGWRIEEDGTLVWIRDSWYMDGNISAPERVLACGAVLRAAGFEVEEIEETDDDGPFVFALAIATSEGS